MGDTAPIPGHSRGLWGLANLTVLLKFVPDQPLLPWQRKFEMNLESPFSHLTRVTNLESSFS